MEAAGSSPLSVSGPCLREIQRTAGVAGCQLGAVLASAGFRHLVTAFTWLDTRFTVEIEVLPSIEDDSNASERPSGLHERL